MQTRRGHPTIATVGCLIVSVAALGALVAAPTLERFTHVVLVASVHTPHF